MFWKLLSSLGSSPRCSCFNQRLFPSYVYDKQALFSDNLELRPRDFSLGVAAVLNIGNENSRVAVCVFSSRELKIRVSPTALLVKNGSSAEVGVKGVPG